MQPILCTLCITLQISFRASSSEPEIVKSSLNHGQLDNSLVRNKNRSNKKSENDRCNYFVAVK